MILKIRQEKNFKQLNKTKDLEVNIEKIEFEEGDIRYVLIIIFCFTKVQDQFQLNT